MAPLNFLLEHRLLSDNEAEAISKKYNTPLNKFPKILDKDPQIGKLNASPKQLIEIKREDPTGKYTYYRYVIES